MGLSGPYLNGVRKLKDFEIALNTLRDADPSNKNSQRFLKEAARVLRTKGYFVYKSNVNYKYIDPKQLVLLRRAWGTERDEQFLMVANDPSVHEKTMLGHDRLYIIWQALLNTRLIKSPTMEVGVFKGGTSAFIALASEKILATSRAHYAIDTFSGHMEGDVTNEDVHSVGLFGDNSFNETQSFLSTVSDQILVRAGRLNEINEEIESLNFSFVHLDVDIYKPTREYLDFLESRLAIGGIVIVDDYLAPKCPGIYKAVSEFLADYPGRFHVWTQPTEQIILTRIG